MDGLAGVLIILAIGVLAAGPLALILTLVLFSKIGKLEEKMRWLSSGRPVSAPPRPFPVPTAPPAPQPTQPTMETPVTAPKAPPPVKHVPTTPQASPPPPAPPAPKVFDVPIPPPPVSKPAAPKRPRVGLEQKIGTTVALIAGIITVIVGVGFFLKYVYDHAWFGPTARVCVVAVGGLAAMIVGEVTRRRGYEIVAKGTAAMGFALLYAAVFSASRVYFLIETQTAFVLAIAITAGAMAYAVALNEVVIAFLSLLGGYLSPIVITTGQNLAMPLFSYLLALAAGALGCAMFRRWRAVNWITMVGTYLLYTGWFEKFYTPDQMPLALSWLGVFGGLFLLQPILYGLKQQIAARAEDVGLVVANSVAVFYYLWRILYAEHPQAQAFAAATVGAVHLLLMAAVMVRCRDDRKLHAALGVLGTAFITVAIPLHFAALNPTLLSWSVQAVALTYIGIRYRSLWTKAMAVIVTAIAAAGLFYHLPLGGTESFRIVFNAPFGTWMFVSAAVLVCHTLWRFMAEAKDTDGRFAAEIAYIVGVLLMAVGCTMEWFAYCDRFFDNDPAQDAAFWPGMIVIAAALTAVLLTRPVCPKGRLVRTSGVLTAFAGSLFTALAMMGVYHSAFHLFFNIPFALASLYAAVVLLCAWHIRRIDDKTPQRDQVTAAMGIMGVGLLFVLLAEQGYWYWYCQNKFAQPITNWQASAVQTVAICWAAFGLGLLTVALKFDRLWLKAAAVLTAAASAAILLWTIPLHTSDDFRLMLNLPFVAWLTVAAALVAGHGLWRTMKIADLDQRSMTQIYYAAGVLLAAVGWTMEWYAHCRWHVTGSVGEANFLLGTMLLPAAVMMVFLAQPLPPKGELVRTLGVLAALGGAVFTVIARKDVHTAAFALFLNVPFAVTAVFVAAMMAGAWCVRRAVYTKKNWEKVPAIMVLAGLVLVWVILSQEVYLYWACRNTWAGPVDNWRFSAQMYMSVAWAIYAAVLVIGGFVFRARSVRYLSLLIFAVLLAKIFLKDTVTLRIEYRIAAFLTTGIILVGISFLYKFLKKKGFFEEKSPTTENEAKE
ncbi:MAG: DUF2339 domain-containing protein [Phycisphaerae bacterium]|nr:DUF2339 domain-containing protein [Phycisphaerae bacterium]